MLFFLERILFAQLFIEARVRYYIVMYGHVEEKKSIIYYESVDKRGKQNISKHKQNRWDNGLFLLSDNKHFAIWRITN